MTFKGTTTKWPSQKQTHNKKHLELNVTNIKDESLPNNKKNIFINATNMIPPTNIEFLHWYGQ